VIKGVEVIEEGGDDVASITSTTSTPSTTFALVWES